MASDLFIPGIDLNDLAVAVDEAEQEHRQTIPLIDDIHRNPTGCSCGVLYNPDRSWEESRQHLQRVRAHAVLQALHRPCDSCLGAGIWTKMRDTFECPDCNGRGRTLTPLSRYMFCDGEDEIWTVKGIEDVRDGTGRAWIQRVTND